MLVNLILLQFHHRLISISHPRLKSFFPSPRIPSRLVIFSIDIKHNIFFSSSHLCFSCEYIYSVFCRFYNFMCPFSIGFAFFQRSQARSPAPHPFMLNRRELRVFSCTSFPFPLPLLIPFVTFSTRYYHFKEVLYIFLF